MLNANDYDERGTELCEHALVTVIGDAGFWGRSLYLVGALVPRYLVGAVAPPTPAHVGSRDVDLAVAFAVDGFDASGYETLERNLRAGGFRQAPNEGDPEFRWRRTLDGAAVLRERADAGVPVIFSSHELELVEPPPSARSSGTSSRRQRHERPVS